ncbi:hypothetical protein [Aquimarina intermedia]|uniref:Uncharacterized protein n=1 Tax=Aquimarina intermedia TaxID=350814 RepID=A0A5S5C7A6_9FLAO|nr:hypothetical protein [Aquimarina intermedia]TYP74210.1 hypothetical protein BD809_10425 [Aquimarina intermedia]
MRFLAISLLALVFVQCKSVVPKNTYKPLAVVQQPTVNPFFTDFEYDYVYKINIEVYGNEMSGLLIIKRIGEDAHRVVCTSQFGTTFFDFELSPKGNKVHTVIEAMDKKFIINTLLRDFTTLIQPKAEIKKAYQGVTYKVLKTAGRSQKNFYFYTGDSEQLSRIIRSGMLGKQITINFDAVDINKATAITINHHDIALAMALELIKN